MFYLVVESKISPSSDPYNNKQDFTHFYEFFTTFLKDGFECIYCFDEDSCLYPVCSYTLINIFAYSLSMFLFSYSLVNLMRLQKTKRAKYIFALAVPITFFAFYVGSFSIDGMMNLTFHAMDVLALMTVGTGVFMYNINDEKRQRANI